MLPKELLIFSRSGAVGGRVSPTINEIATLAATSTAVPGRLVRGGRVIDDPDLVKSQCTERDLVEIGVVGDPVGVNPVGTTPLAALVRIFVSFVFPFASTDVADRPKSLHFGRRYAPADADVVNVDKLRVIRHNTKVALPRVVILDQVIPKVPLPNDLSASRAIGLNFDHVIRPDFVVLDQLRIAPGGDRLFGGFQLPGDHENVAIREYFEIVVQAMVFVGILKIPEQVSFPVEPPNALSYATTAEVRILRIALAGKQITILEQIIRARPPLIVWPRVNHIAVQVDKIRTRRAKRSEQRISGRRFPTADGTRVAAGGNQFDCVGRRTARDGRHCQHDQRCER